MYAPLGSTLDGDDSTFAPSHRLSEEVYISMAKGSTVKEISLATLGGLGSLESSCVTFLGV